MSHVISKTYAKTKNIWKSVKFIWACCIFIYQIKQPYSWGHYKQSLGWHSGPGTWDRLLLFSCSVMSHSLWPHGLQHARPPCPSPTHGVHPDPCPLSQWCHPTICHPLLLPSIFPSIRVFSNESALCIWWPKYWSFSFSISPSSEYSGLISFRRNWLISLQSKG